MRETVTLRLLRANYKACCIHAMAWAQQLPAWELGVKTPSRDPPRRTIRTLRQFFRVFASCTFGRGESKMHVAMFLSVLCCGWILPRTRLEPIRRWDQIISLLQTLDVHTCA